MIKFCLDTGYVNSKGIVDVLNFIDDMEKQKKNWKQ